MFSSKDSPASVFLRPVGKISIGLALPFFLSLFSLLSPCLQSCLGMGVESGKSGEAKPSIIAHRGGRKWAPENTMAAFTRSVQLGVDGIELDIHRCKSGELVVIHDETLERTTDGTGLVADISYDQLSKLSAGAWYGEKFKDERVPRLSDVLDMVDGRTTVNIEVKNAPIAYPGIEEDLGKMLSSYKHPERIVVSSFDHEFLVKFHKIAPSIKTAILGCSIISGVGNYAGAVGASAWNTGYGELRKDVVERARESGVEVNVWTVDGDELWTRMIEYGVDGIITDDPEGLKKFISREKP